MELSKLLKLVAAGFIGLLVIGVLTSKGGEEKEEQTAVTQPTEVAKVLDVNREKKKQIKESRKNGEIGITIEDFEEGWFNFIDNSNSLDQYHLPVGHIKPSEEIGMSNKMYLYSASVGVNVKFDNSTLGIKEIAVFGMPTDQQSIVDFTLIHGIAISVADPTLKPDERVDILQGVVHDLTGEDRTDTVEKNGLSYTLVTSSEVGNWLLIEVAK